MLLTEYNEELDRKELFEMGLEEGRAEGRIKGQAGFLTCVRFFI